MTESSIQIVDYLSVASRPGLAAALDDIFFEASTTRSFDSENARSAFRWRWLGRYLEAGPEHAFLAMSLGGQVAGYLVGAMADPAKPLDPELPFYALFAEQTCVFPAHLHINLAPERRSKGTGSRLIEAFAQHARQLGAPGMHVVTTREARNVRFYMRCGFQEVASTRWNGHLLLMLGRGLDR